MSSIKLKINWMPSTRSYVGILAITKTKEKGKVRPQKNK